MLTQYTSYAEVRAALGVNDVELSDDTLALGMYLQNLTAELEEVDVGLPAKYKEVAGIDAAARSDVQRRFFESTQLFSTYTVAKQLSSSLPMFGPKDVVDQKASVSRFSDSPFKKTIEKVCAAYDLNRSRLMKAYGALTTTDRALPGKTFMVISTPTTDRVTG